MKPLPRTASLLTLAVFLHPAQSPASLPLTGVNLSGAEFGYSSVTATNRGTYGTHYTYPTHGEVDYFVSKGLNTFRLPFTWERLQPTLNSALNPTELARVDDFVNYATGKGATVILDPHNFDR